MPTARKLTRWRYSAQVLATRPTDIAGELVAGNASEALELVARDMGCALPLPAFHYWHHGGHASATNSAGEEVAIVVVAFGPAIADRPLAAKISDGTPGPKRLAARFNGSR